MATQWPQQYQGPHNQNYNSYPQQQQHHPQQQYQQQHHHHQHHQHHQHRGQQNGTYQQQYQQQYPQQYQQNAHSIPHQQQPQPEPNSCYNCGAADHWAQDCPEPRRELPAGQIHRQSYSRPFKRHKPNAPVVTKYPVPPHIQPQYGLAQGYGGGQYGQHSYPPQQGYGPPTPMSAHSPSQVQWQQSPQYQNYQQPFQQGNHYQQSGPYPQHSYPTPTAQTPGSYYGNNNSHQNSPQGPPYNAKFYPQHGQYSQQQGFQGQAYSGASPGSVISPTNGYALNQYPEGKKPNSVNTRQGTYNASQVKPPCSTTSKSQKTSVASTEPEGNDINKLDVPDMPPSSRDLTDQIILLGKSSIHLVGRPLPLDHAFAENVSTLGLPQNEGQSYCQSKYWGSGTTTKLSQNIRHSSDWDDVQQDAIFSYNPHDTHVIPLDDLLAICRPYHAEENEQQPEVESEAEAKDEGQVQVKIKAEAEDEIEAEAEANANANADAEIETDAASKAGPKVDSKPEPESEHHEATPEHKGGSSPRDSWDVMNSLEHALIAGRQKESNSANGTNSSPEEESRQPKDTEELLAALGVTGAPKPIRAPARPYPPPSQERLTHSSPSSFSRSRSRTPTRREINGSYHQGYRSRPGVGNDQRVQDVNGSSNRPDTYKYKQSGFQEPFSSGRNSRDSAEIQYSHQFEPPPPPPPPVQKCSFPERTMNSPLFTGNGHGDNQSHTDHQAENRNGYGRFTTPGHSMSPTRVRSERANGRKREYDNRESSDESETPGRRQADDVTPKLKRRQPKVAEAYSRRW